MQTKLKILIKLSMAIVILSFSIALLPAQSAAQSNYNKAVEGGEVVRNKLFPKKNKVEINGPNLGMILNQSYIDSYVAHGGINYFVNEEWGFGIEGLVATNKDKSERTCIENFFNNPPPRESILPCSPDPSVIPDNSKVTYGPAYVPIREIDYIVAATAVWNPIYGKQLFFLSATGYLDLYLTMGGGLVFSKFYKKQTQLGNGNPSRGETSAEGTGGPSIGTTADEIDTNGNHYYGIEGRPEAEENTNAMFTLGIGQKYHFAKRFNFKIELRNYTLIGTDAGFDLFFSLMSGVGMRF
ncbi:MAG: outer membrane beta-barrel domain-containing protein [Bdellovibrionota bacterium]